MDILADLNRHDGITVLVSLHQVEYALRYCPRTVALRAGEVVYDGPSSALTRQFLSSIYGAESDDLFASVDAQPLEPAPAAETLDPAHRFRSVAAGAGRAAAEAARLATFAAASSWRALIGNSTTTGSLSMSSFVRRAAFAAAALAGSVTLAQAETPAELNFGVISTEASMNQKKNWEPFIEAMSKAHRPQDQGVLRHRLRRRDRGDALQQGARRLVRQQIGDRGGGSLQRRGVRPGRSRRTAARLLLAHHRARRQPVHQGRGHPEVRQVA